MMLPATETDMENESRLNPMAERPPGMQEVTRGSQETWQDPLSSSKHPGEPQ
jgi:hypothetical protein